jgi:hypothetical protein
MTTLPLSEVTARLSEIADEVYRTHERVAAPDAPVDAFDGIAQCRWHPTGWCHDLLCFHGCQ